MAHMLNNDFCVKGDAINLLECDSIAIVRHEKYFAAWQNRKCSKEINDFLFQ